jgi:hypothetical protein
MRLSGLHYRLYACRSGCQAEKEIEKKFGPEGIEDFDILQILPFT